MRGVRWVWLSSLSLGAGLLIYCAAPPPPEARSPFSLPLGATKAGEPPTSASAAAPAVPLGTDRYTPLLARPGFEAVMAALEDGDAPRARAALEVELAKRPPVAAELPSFRYLRAWLAERSADPTQALALYRDAARPEYVLAPYAKLGAARALLALGRAKESLAEVEALPANGALSAPRRELFARACLAAGDRDRALPAFRELLANAPSTAQRSSIALELASLLLSPPNGAAVPEEVAIEALELARKAGTDAASDRTVSARARELEAQALRALPERTRADRARPSPAEELARVTALVDAREFEDAAELAGSLASRLQKADRSSPIACDLALSRAKAQAGLRQWGAAVDGLSTFLETCKARADWHARSLFLLGKYASYDKRYAQAVRFFETIELEHAKNSLADDSRLLGALAYSELGVEARFTELLSSIGDAYPDGDMTVEGMFRLAVKRMDRGDWRAVSSILARAVVHLGDKDAVRGNEVAGRERYFAARAELELGRREQALAGFEDVVVRFPLSYYMLNAHARLAALDPERAKRARERALAEAARESRPLATAALVADPDFARGLELLRVGDTRSAVSELELAGGAESASTELLWTVAALYSRAGATKLGHDVARYRLTDWLTRWPAGDWLEPWRIAFPRAFGNIVEREAKVENLPPSIVFAIMREESAFDPAAESPADAHGLMQLIVPTARSAAKGTNLPHDRRSLKRPSINIKLGVRTLARFMRRFPSNPLLGIPGYNAGPARAKQWLDARPHADFDLWVELIPYLETRRYTKRVLASRATYAFLYEPEAGDNALSLPVKVNPASAATP